MHRRRFAAPVALTFALLLTACSAAPKRTLPQAPPAVTDTVTIRLDNSHGQLDSPLMDTLIGAFQERYPQYRVEKIDLVNNGVRNEDEVVSAMKRGQVDVVSESYQSEFFAKGCLTLDALIQKDNLDLKPYGSLMEMGLVGGHHYALPLYLMPYMMNANVELLSAAGVTLPEQNWTWDEFRRAAKKATNPVGEKPVWGVAEPAIEYLMRIYLEGQADRPAWAATDAELRAALGFFQTLIQLDKSIEPPRVRTWDPEHQSDDGSFGARIQAFAGRQSAFLMGGGFTVGAKPSSWNQPLPVPSHPGRPYTMFTEVQWLSVAAGSHNPDAAWAFVKFAAGREGAALAAKSGFPPGFVDESIQAAWFSAEPQPIPLTSAFFNARWIPGRAPGMATQRNEYRLYRLANRVLAEGMDVDAALGEFHKEMNGAVPGM